MRLRVTHLMIIVCFKFVLSDTQFTTEWRNISLADDARGKLPGEGEGRGILNFGLGRAQRAKKGGLVEWMGHFNFGLDREVQPKGPKMGDCRTDQH